jgi:DNA-directed RNA polymerase subunit M/transcription elongation factor TFIIS
MKTSNCNNCNCIIHYRESQSFGKYCSNKCQKQFQNKNLIESWIKGKWNGLKKGFVLSSVIRNHLIELSNNKCSLCGWDKINSITNKIPLEIDHIDGNCQNSQPENLRVLCPNCHSLTPTYRALNKGKGNKTRLKYNKLI